MTASADPKPFDPDERVDWLRSVPFILMHLAPLGIIWTGFGWREAALAFGLYVVRMFFITAGFHRYFGHRSYKTGRVMQFILAFGGGTSVQKGALWWAAHHRHHHKHSDMDEDVHSPKRGFWWSHMGWIMCTKYHRPPHELIRDFARYPELMFLDRHHAIPPLVLGTACTLWGGWSYLMAFFVSTVFLYHGTFVINSLTHVWGSRRYATTDTSRNNLWLALITLGEGWHNNHHHYQRSTSQGFFWWEIDISYYVLKVMSWVGLVWGLHTPPDSVKNSKRVDRDEIDVAMGETAPLLEPSQSMQ
jgi:stearoyl-CoA desaturase (delta-9 desaturase)